MRDEIYDHDLRPGVGVTRRRKWRNVGIFFALQGVVVAASYFGGRAWVDKKIDAMVACAQRRAAAPPYAIRECLTMRGELWAVRWLPWVRGRVNQGERRGLEAMAARYAEIVPRKAISGALVESAAETYLNAIQLGVDFTTPASWLGALGEGVITTTPNHGTPLDWDVVLRAQLGQADRDGLAKTIRRARAPAAKSGDGAARFTLARCLADGKTCAAPAAPPATLELPVMPSTDYFVFDARFAPYDPESMTQTRTLAGELRRALGALSLGRWETARNALAGARLVGAGAPEVHALEELMKRLLAPPALRPSGGEVASVAPESLALEVTRLQTAGMRAAPEVITEMIARGLPFLDIQAVVSAAFATPRVLREHIGVAVLMERAAISTGDPVSAAEWKLRREGLTKLYEPATSTLLDTTPF